MRMCSFINSFILSRAAFKEATSMECSFSRLFSNSFISNISFSIRRYSIAKLSGSARIALDKIFLRLSSGSIRPAASCPTPSPGSPIASARSRLNLSFTSLRDSVGIAKYWPSNGPALYLSYLPYSLLTSFGRCLNDAESMDSSIPLFLSLSNERWKCIAEIHSPFIESSLGSVCSPSTLVNMRARICRTILPLPVCLAEYGGNLMKAQSFGSSARQYHLDMYVQLSSPQIQLLRRWPLMYFLLLILMPCVGIGDEINESTGTG
mmetsp:Transcript_38707/g.84968  ORF Transcript_38707/g.84968 Transcript_38707/m.84968 type:complete len:264 (-) Transcript_38707:382-1173(-)